MSSLWSKYENFFLEKYKGDLLSDYLRAKYELWVSTFILIVSFFVSLLHYIFIWEWHHIIADILLVSCFAISIIVLRLKKNKLYIFFTISGVFLFVAIEMVYADYYLNHAPVTHQMHIFHSVTFMLLAFSYFGFLFDKRRTIIGIGFIGILLLLAHGYALYREFPDDYIQFLTIAACMEFSVGVLGAITVNSYFKYLLKKSNEQNYIISQQAASLGRKSEKLNRSYKDLEMFSYAISHDLKEPLRTMSGFTTLLNKELAKENPRHERIQEYSRFIVDGNTRMTRMIDTLMDYARININNEDNQTVNLNDVVLTAKSNISRLIEDKKAEIIVADLPNVWASKNLMILLFQNLITNAIKYCLPERTPKVEIAFTEKKNNYIITFKDNGLGIEERFQQRIFDIFTRGNNKKVEGTGIGLATCKRILELHNGSVSLESTLGEGSTFTVILPKASKIRLTSEL